jgi:purine-binding chemotaxis protein CheW
MSEIRQYVGFMLGNEKFAISIMDVEEIIRLTEITPVPKAPDFIEGIINLRGRVIPVADLKKRINLGEADYDENKTRIVVVMLNDKRMGLIIDSVDEIIRIESSDVEQAPALTVNMDASYIEGVAKTEKGMIIILNIHKIFTSDEQNMLNFF